MCINEKRFGDVKCIFNLKGSYSFKPLHEKTKTPVTQFILHVIPYGKWSCHEKKTLRLVYERPDDAEISVIQHCLCI